MSTRYFTQDQTDNLHATDLSKTISFQKQSLRNYFNMPQVANYEATQDNSNKIITEKIFL